MATIEVDLTTAAEGTISSAAVDQTFWSTYSQDATAFAAQYGYTAVPDDTNSGSIERNVNNWSDWTAWVQTVASVSVAVPANASNASGPSGIVIAGVAVGAVGLVALVWWLATRKS